MVHIDLVYGNYLGAPPEPKLKSTNSAVHVTKVMNILLQSQS
jgi:hypothetical protein